MCVPTREIRLADQNKVKSRCRKAENRLATRFGLENSRGVEDASAYGAGADTSPNLCSARRRPQRVSRIVTGTQCAVRGAGAAGGLLTFGTGGGARLATLGGVSLETVTDAGGSRAVVSAVAVSSLALVSSSSIAETAPTRARLLSSQTARADSTLRAWCFERTRAAIPPRPHATASTP